MGAWIRRGYLAFWGRPDLQSRGPQTLLNKHFGTSGLKIGAPQQSGTTSDPGRASVL